MSLEKSSLIIGTDSLRTFKEENVNIHREGASEVELFKVDNVIANTWYNWNLSGIGDIQVVAIQVNNTGTATETDKITIQNSLIVNNNWDNNLLFSADIDFSSILLSLKGFYSYVAYFSKSSVLSIKSTIPLQNLSIFAKKIYLNNHIYN
jgi:hypothetical protein